MELLFRKGYTSLTLSHHRVWHKSTFAIMENIQHSLFMQGSDVRFLTGSTRAIKGAPFLSMTASAFPTPFAILEPLQSLVGV